MATKKRPKPRPKTPKRPVSTQVAVEQKPHNPRNNSRVILMAVGAALAVLSIVLSVGDYRHRMTFHKIYQALRANPTQGTSYEQMGEYYEANRDYDVALAQYQLAQTYGDDQAAIAQKRVNAKLSAPNDIKQAIGEWYAFVEQHPTYVDGWIAIALLAYQIGDKNLVSQAAQQALSRNPQSQPAQALFKAN